MSARSALLLDVVGRVGHGAPCGRVLVRAGQGEVWIDGQRTRIESDDAIVVPAGAKHNVVNTGDKAMRLYTIYGPPDHKDAVVRATKAEAEATEEHFDGTTTE